MRFRTRGISSNITTVKDKTNNGKLGNRKGKDKGIDGLLMRCLHGINPAVLRK